jgi:hypothetical protein
MPLVFDKAKDTWTCSIHGDVGDNTGWVRCYAMCEDGAVDDYEDDPINCDPGDFSTCQECGGAGGFRVCGECNPNNPDVEW